MLRCDVELHAVTEDTVFLVDADRGNMSVTNDAENVLQWCKSRWPGKRVVYCDSMGLWDEIVHESGRFVKFERYRGKVPGL